jgi:dTDP-4-amino-4,6-dideoxygalactose transaminase
MSASAPYIPFNRPFVSGSELEFIQQAINNGHLSGDGVFTKRCHAIVEKELGVSKALLTTSCTHALEMTALLLEIHSGDEVIVPSFTFPSTTNAFVLRGARPAFIDVRADTLNLDENLLERLITPRTKAILVVHYAGVGCEMDALLEVSARHGVPLIEDNAHGLFGKYKGKHLGTFGPLATLSFHETKNFSCGEGGALLINDTCYNARAEIIREKGTNRSRFFRGEVDKYTWVDVGSSYLPSDALAAFLCAQLEARDVIQSKRKRIWDYYFANLTDWAENSGVRLPHVPTHCEQSYYMFYLLLRTIEERQAMIAHLKTRGVHSVFHYLPLHLSEMGRQLGGKAGDCPVTENMSDRLLRLPFYGDLTEADQARVVSAIMEFPNAGKTPPRL